MSDRMMMLVCVCATQADRVSEGMIYVSDEDRVCVMRGTHTYAVRHVEESVDTPCTVS